MGNDLASCPTWTPQEARDESDGHTIRGMKISSFPKFGFVIYRCTYSDDAVWTELLSLIKKEAQAHIKELIKELGPGRDWLGTHLEWTIVEDPTLDGASQEEVNARFDKWADEIVDESERTSTNVLRWLPRFNFCAVVDEKCLASMEKSKSKTEGIVGKSPPVFVVLIRAQTVIPAWMGGNSGGGGSFKRRRLRRLSDGDSVDETEQDLEDEERRRREEEQEEEDEIEHRGDTPVESNEGNWMLVEPTFLLSLYNILHANPGWEAFYVRPPGIYSQGKF